MFSGYNQTLCKVNESVIRLGVMQGEYHWHKHDNDDEFFFVLSGRFIIDLEGRSVELLPNQGFTVPKGVFALHARAREECDLDGRDCRHRANGRYLIYPESSTDERQVGRRHQLFGMKQPVKYTSTKQTMTASYVAKSTR